MQQLGVNNVLVSVLMTSYNREKYIGEAIESLLASTYNNFELIIVDDGSVDETFLIAKEFEKKDSRIKVYINEKNLGDYHNRNKAAGYAKGKYLKYLDSDDLIYPHSLQIMVDYMESFPDIPFAFCGKEFQDYSTPYPVIYSPVESFRAHFIKGGLLNAGPSLTIIRKQAFEEAGGFSGKRFISDFELWLSFAMKGNILKIQPGLVWWRTHDEQEYRIGINELHYISLRHNLNKKTLTDSSCPLTAGERKLVLGNFRRLLGRRLYKRVLLKFGFSKMMQTMKDCKENPVILLEAFIPLNKIKKSIARIGGSKQ